MLPRVVPRLSRIWVPNSRYIVSEKDSHGKLIQAGILRPSVLGTFHMLPLGKRIQDKVEGLIAKHMEDTLGASRVSLSSFSTEELWEKTGRLGSVGAQLFRFKDRKDAPYLLAPTHEEEITTLVAKDVQSYKELPLRLYQITRKYRDELRPRLGLLRGREFTMKDLYTFDHTVPAALETYEQVRKAYNLIFQEMKLPVLVAAASSGDMGGDLSHEYHLPIAIGEDDLVTCSSCTTVSNVEVAKAKAAGRSADPSQVKVWRGITKDRTTLVNVWYQKTISTPKGDWTYSLKDININAVKAQVPDLDTTIPLHEVPDMWTAALAGSGPAVQRIVNLVDERVAHENFTKMWPHPSLRPREKLSEEFRFEEAGAPLNLLHIRDGDRCHHCSDGTLQMQKAIELGHTFHLGTRYSKSLDAAVSSPVAPKTDSAQEATKSSVTQQQTLMQMGCHGIGVSRIIGAVAESLQDDRGLNWPAAIAPFSCAIIVGRPEYNDDALQLYKQMSQALMAEDGHFDVVVDDRSGTVVSKMTDGDHIGFPVMVVMGRDWPSGKVEIQCRRLSVKEVVKTEQAPARVQALLSQL